MLDQFYKDNQDLEKYEDLVDLTYQKLKTTDSRIQQLVRDRNMVEVFKVVGDETRKRLVEITGRKSEPPRPTGKGGRMAVAEGGGGPLQPRGGKPEEEEEEDGTPKTMSAAIKAKQRRHQGAHQGRPDAARRAER